MLETMEQIRQGRIEPGDLPPIQVIIGTDETCTDDGGGGEPWYFSLNNRRLWVLKQCHKEGLLDNERYNNKIGVRARMARSHAETLRYTVDNCALEAKFIREDIDKNRSKQKKKKGGARKKKIEEEGNRVDGSRTNEPGTLGEDRCDKIDSYGTCVNIDKDSNGESDDNNDDDDGDEDFVSSANPFSVLS